MQNGVAEVEIGEKIATIRFSSEYKRNVACGRYKERQEAQLQMSDGEKRHAQANGGSRRESPN